MELGTCIGMGLLATIVLMVVIYALIMPKSKDGHLSKFGQFLHDYFHFKKLYIESVIRFFFTLSTVACVAIGVFLLFGKTPGIFDSGSSTAIYGILLIICGPIINRFAYELAMLNILLVKNAIEINSHLNGKTSSVFDSEGKATEFFSQKTVQYATQISNAAQAAAQEMKQQAESKAQENTENAVGVCPNCGAPVEADQKFCTSCGTKLEEE